MYSATIKTSMQADIHIAHCRPHTCSLVLVLDSLNEYSCQSIFHSYEPGARSLNQTLPPRFIATHHFSLLPKKKGLLSNSLYLAELSISPQPLLAHLNSPHLP